MAKQKTKKQTTQQLKQAGFIKVKGFKFLFINANGEAFNNKTAQIIKPNCRNDIYIERKRQSLPKLILNVFAKQLIRSGQITYLDGNRSNLAVQNLKYSRIFAPQTQSTVSKTALMTAIRCYFRVPKNYKIADSIQTQLYLQTIVQHRAFYVTHYKAENLEVFKDYIEGFSKNQSITAKAHKLSVHDVKTITDQLTNLLSNEILQDLKAGELIIQEFRPKPPTQTEILKKTNIDRLTNGLQPLPLRKLSQKERDKQTAAKIEAFHEYNRKFLEQPEN
jgi:hypothetical protein